MAYSERAKARRRCTSSRKDGQSCRAWAVWDDPRQLCVNHAGRNHRGPIDPRRPGRWDPAREKTKYVPCTCPAYNWPHRPGGGLCRWPEPPIWRRTTPAGTHSWPRNRYPGWYRQFR